MQVTINEGNNQLNIAMTPVAGQILYDSLTVPAQYLTEIHSLNGIPFSEVGETVYDGNTIPYARLVTPIVANTPMAVDLEFIWRYYRQVSGEWVESNSWAYVGGDKIEFMAQYSNPSLPGSEQPVLDKIVNPPRVSDGGGSYHWNLPITGHVVLNQISGGATIYYAQALYDILLGTQKNRPDYPANGGTCVILEAVQVLTAGSLSVLPAY
jgi:hypothetical protein